MAGVPRFFRVLKGQRGASAKQKYLNYLNGIDIEDNVGGGSPKPDNQVLYVRSYNLSLPDTVWLKTSASVPAWNAFKGQSAISSRTKESVASQSTSIKVRSFKAARFAQTTGIVDSGTRKVSKLTGLPYLSYGGRTLSVPFGKGAGADTYGDAVGDLTTIFGNQRNSRISFTEELS